MKSAALREGMDTAAKHNGVLKICGLRLGYSGRTVLDHVELVIRTGDFWCVVGPNGQGKTTLLRAILGRLQPEAGSIERSGDFARPDRIGFVPQQSHFNPTLPTTIREFVTLGLVGIPVAKRDREERFSWSLQQVGLSGMSARDFWSLSVGQRQRALVARALVRKPSILIADEPTSGLDLSVESALYESLAELNRRQGLTVILVTHDLAVAARYGSHFALVHACCVQAGPAGQVLTVQNLEHAYGVPVSVEHDATGSVAVRIGMPGGGA